MKQKTLILIGGNSEIGNALASGIATRLGVKTIVRVSRTKSEGANENTVRVESYENIDFDSLKEIYQIKSIIIAFGVLESEKNYLEDLETNIEINVFQYLKVCAKATDFLAANPKTELHITSSIVADFSRESIFAYSLSKSIMEDSLRFMLRNSGLEKASIFFWKLSFVNTKMNSNREKSIISTNLESITSAAENVSRPGTYYLPKFAKFPSRILHHFPQITKRLG